MCDSTPTGLIEPLQDFDRTPTILYPWAITVFYYYDLIKLVRHCLVGFHVI